jgi:predicted GIY-YIG superfamily endonuclease
MVIYKITNKLNGKVYIGQTTQPLKRRWRNHCETKKGAMDSAIAKYGKENFDIEIIDIAETLEELNEKEKYWIKEYDSLAPKGYNLTYGGNNGKRHPDVGKRISESLKGHMSGENSVRSKKTYQFNIEGELINVYASAGEAAKANGLTRSWVAACCKGKHKYTGQFTWNYEPKPHNKEFNRSYVYIRYNGEYYIIRDLAKIIGMDPGTIAYRKRAGWSDEKIVNTPLNENKSNKKRRNLKF